MHKTINESMKNSNEDNRKTIEWIINKTNYSTKVMNEARAIKKAMKSNKHKWQH